MKRSAGFTLIELVVATAVFALLGIFLVMAITSANKARSLQKALSTLEQDTGVAAELLRTDLARAGFRGDLTDDTFGCLDLGQSSAQCQWTNSEKAQALDWIWNNWQQLRDGSASLPTLEVTSGKGGSDELSIRFLSPIKQKPAGSSAKKRYPAIYKDAGGWPYLHYGLQMIRYKLGTSSGSTGYTLKREVDEYVCPQNAGVDVTQDPAPAVDCTRTTNGSAQPIILLEAEDFQVFFLNKNGSWQNTRPPAGDTVAVGIYLRTVYPGAVGPERCGPWPSKNAKALLPDTPSALGIASTTYTGRACKQPRTERVLTVSLSNPQTW